MQDGPMWPNWSDNERLFCRRHGWTNMLYLNNFIDAKEPVGSFMHLSLAFMYVINSIRLQCMQHGWYLASDFQLTIVGSIIQMIIWRYTKFTKTIYTLTITISFLIPAALTYINRFEGAFMATPE